MFTISEYKGNLVITLKRSEEDRYPFSFGLSKAKLIIDHYEDIKKFFEENKDKAKSKPAEA